MDLAGGDELLEAASVIALSLPLKPPIAITDLPVASSIPAACLRRGRRGDPRVRGGVGCKLGRRRLLTD